MLSIRKSSNFLQCLSGQGAYAAWLLVMSHASIAMYVTQVVIHQHDCSLVRDICQQCL